MNTTSTKAVEKSGHPSDPAASTPGSVGRWRQLKSDLQALPRPVWILCFGTFLNKFGAFVIPFLALYLTRRGFTTAHASLALMAYGGGHFVATGLGGYMTDRFGRRNTIVLSMFLAALTMGMMAFAESLTMILTLAFLVGLAGEFYRPACSALLVDLVPSHQRVTAFAAYRLALNAGWAFGPAVAGFLVHYSYFWLFVGDALTSALFGVVALSALPHGLRSGRDNCGWTSALKVAFSDRRFVQIMVASFAVALVFFQMSSSYGLQVTALGFSPAVYGYLISLNGVLVVLFELPVTTITQRLNTRRVMALGYLLIGGGFALNALADGWIVLAIGITIFTFGEMLCMPVSFAYLSDLAPTEMRGRYMGLFGYTWSVALIIGPGLGVLVFEGNPAALWCSCGVLGLLAAWTITRDHGVP